MRVDPEGRERAGDADVGRRSPVREEQRWAERRAHACSAAERERGCGRGRGTGGCGGGLRERCGHAGERERDAAMREGRERCGWVGGKGDKVSWLGERR
jgi:hypothetical protein